MFCLLSQKDPDILRLEKEGVSPSIKDLANTSFHFLSVRVFITEQYEEEALLMKSFQQRVGLDLKLHEDAVT